MTFAVASDVYGLLFVLIALFSVFLPYYLYSPIVKRKLGWMYGLVWLAVAYISWSDQFDHLIGSGTRYVDMVVLLWSLTVLFVSLFWVWE